ncbi:timeless-domain-containing protein [Fomitiporia mediterranea MF3/22]|uniref:timeless-domain-containing protein n=1 Tax=Fomitiporia mediterranea (strain MF3/22) TaxID=694068 RepID=UPI000440834E|nr:timeless-domain-containing protein [Fomitiporia mediterranea MF3/22]EJD01845.1 timeless-domain-containing protein [Fomitiporia mediterranea MF3/22]
MDRDEEISVQSDDEERQEQIDRRAILAPAINDVVTALGGYEGDTYVLGDECYGCLKDLKKFWRKDDTDDERTVARIFWEARVLPNDLVPILLATAGKGLVTDKCAIACADIITAMTWPIDLAEELKELDEELDKGTDYTQLLQSHLHYKAALLRPGVIQALFGILLPCIAKDKKERSERDGQIINVILHLFRNLAFIKDRAPNMHASANHAELSALQSRLVKTYAEAHVLELLVTIASNAKDPFFNQWNTLVLEIFYLLFRSVFPSALAVDQTKRAQKTLSELLAAENKLKLENSRKASSRHSRFGTTISVIRNPNKAQQINGDTTSAPIPSDASTPKVVLHRQQALNQETGNILDMKKRRQYKKTNKVDELGLQDYLDQEAKTILQGLARTFVEVCFNTFLASILKDIKSERPKITEKDHLRLLFATRWFLEFFLAVRTAQIENSEQDGQSIKWQFDLVSEIVERSWIVWILKRMRGAVEEKPKLWTELQAGVECLIQLLALIDTMHSTELEDPELSEAAELLQQQLVYNGEVLDISVDSLRAYKEGVQSLQYLDASVKLGYSLLRMLEKWARERGGGELLVRKKKAKRRKRKDEVDEEEIQVQPEPDSDEEHAVQEIIFTFETFELKFAHEEITHTLMTYLGRYEEFTSSEQMKRVVNLLHRQAVKAKAEGLFFKVSTLNLFRNILSRQATLPREQPYKDLVALINFILRKFFKAVAEDPMLIVEAFYPKTRNRWKKYSSWEPEAKVDRGRDKDVETDKHPAEVQVKKGFSWSEQLGIAIACLLENGQQELVDWVKEILMMTIGQRQRIIEETDESLSQPLFDDMDDDAARDAANKLRQPSNEALAKFQDYLIPYTSDEHADAATKNSHMKLLFRLLKFSVLNENADELEWFVPAAILPADLESSLKVINQFIDTPLDLGGKKATQMLTKKSRRRRRRRAPSSSGSENGISSDDESHKKRAKKKKEKEKYKSAQFIEDSDVEYGDDEAFWARERAQREKTERLAAEGKMASLRATGTKKRKKPRGTSALNNTAASGEETSTKRRKSSPKSVNGVSDNEDIGVLRSSASESDSGSDSDELGVDAVLDKNTSSTPQKTKKKVKPRPRPRKIRHTPDEDAQEASESPAAANPPAKTDTSTTTASRLPEDADVESDLDVQARKPKTKTRVVFSDDEDG